MEKENKIAGNVERLATLYSAIRAHLETRNQAGIAQQRWRREEGMQRSSERASDGRKQCNAKGATDGSNAAKRQWRTADCSGAATDERMSSAGQKWWGFTGKDRGRARCSTGWYRSVWARGAVERTRAGVVEHAVVLRRVCVAMYSKHCRHTPMAMSASFVRDSTSLLVPNYSLLFSIVPNQLPQAASFCVILPTLLSFCPEAQCFFFLRNFCL